ncbi:hypothetical protein LOTGIDRAFT_125346 [Lottia gigantea]|uniref:Folate receptor-like domain-containing protein n=1 Tax=Lottia gigantea TaxID=225164 RepID=V4A3I8_LOTGI|nr:hypothetical protein LOTGIDRAFT_125346 [Lottia gigantea]ESO89510.1 hypothetical protein LOTGIDRAFT_125346 [Lottia gigantea]
MSVEEYTDTCLDGQHHKKKPGPEADLFSFCSPWKKRSCCTEQITKQMHISDSWYNFNWNHCGDLSANCRSHFLQDLCFYECSPNTGPWLQPVKMKIRNEKFMHVPLCQVDCTNWWEDCKNDLTCTDNWGKNFNWTTGQNRCPVGSSCKKFSDIFSNSTNFCEIVWNYSWKVVADTESCMHLWFDAKIGNPNDKVALNRAELIISNSARVFSPFTFHLLLITGLFIYTLL